MLWPSATLTSLGTACLLNTTVPGANLPFLSVRGHQNCATCTTALLCAALRGGQGLVGYASGIWVKNGSQVQGEALGGGAALEDWFSWGGV